MPLAVTGAAPYDRRVTFVERLTQIRNGPRPRRERLLTPFVHVDFGDPAVRKLLAITAPTGRVRRPAPPVAAPARIETVRGDEVVERPADPPQRGSTIL